MPALAKGGLRMPYKRLDDGSWDISVCVKRKRIHRRLPASATARDAKQLDAELRSALGKRLPAIPGDPRLVDLMADYLTHAERLKGPKPARYAALRIGRWITDETASAARHVARRFISDARGKYKPATINKSLGTLKKALRLAYERGATPQNHGDAIKLLPENNLRVVTLTLEQVRAIADKASPNIRAAIWIATYTGCRRGEICAITRADIGTDTITLSAGMTKTDRTRVIPIIPPLRPWLKFLPLPIGARGIESGFRNARKAAKLRQFTFHDLRRSCATLMLSAGVPLHVISKLLGHSSVRITEARYAHLQVEAVREGLERAFTPSLTPEAAKLLSEAA
jgi:integrase